jgi:hypothetical protein
VLRITPPPTYGFSAAENPVSLVILMNSNDPSFLSFTLPLLPLFYFPLQKDNSVTHAKIKQILFVSIFFLIIAILLLTDVTHSSSQTSTLSKGTWSPKL